MRIVSQDKTIDVPYDRATLYIGAFRETHRIYASFGFNDNEDVVLGTYSKERCIEIMQEIRDAAQGIVYMENNENEDVLAEMIEVLHKTPIMPKCSDIPVITSYFYMPEE